MNLKSSCLRLLKCWDYRCVTPHSGKKGILKLVSGRSVNINQTELSRKSIGRENSISQSQSQEGSGVFQLSGSEMEHVGPMSLLRTITGCVPWCWRADLAAKSAFCSCRVPEWLTTACNSNCKRIDHLLLACGKELTCMYPLENAHTYTQLKIIKILSKGCEGKSAKRKIKRVSLDLFKICHLKASFAYLGEGIHMPQCTYGGQKTTWGCQFSPSTI